MANWSKIKSRGRVSDRRGIGGGLVGVGGLGTIGILAVLALTLFGGGEVNVQDILTQLENVQISSQQNNDTSQFAGEDDYEKFASTVLGSNNDMWREVFRASNQPYREPQLVLFRDATRSGCGLASSQIGPHYCPADETIYIDETFFDELTRRFDAQGGDVAEAYVIAHEVGHHVQNLLGTNDQVYAARGSDNANDLSVKLELQADCFAGLWAHSIQGLGVFDEGEISEAMDAAEAVGDDRIQEKTSGRIDPESWTHGSSAQRLQAFNSGFESGQVKSCDTFK